MGKILIIAEKPSVAREIAHALGGFSKVEGWLESASVVISSGIGHLIEIYAPEAENLGSHLDSLPILPAKFGLRAIEKTKSQFNLLKMLMRRADIDQVINACDAGREGELIFRLIYEHADCRKPVKRMWLQSMTTEAILDAYSSMRPSSEFDALRDAAKCRSEADWLVGINGTRGVTRLREKQTQRYELMTAGRVQTPTLAILVYRELEIRNFIPKDYWEVYATFQVRDSFYVGKWFNGSEPMEDEDLEFTGNRFWSKGAAEAIVEKCRGIKPSAIRESSKTTTSAPPKLFDLTSLQREANQKFRFSAKQTLDIAQSLYEKHKAITYPRTDSTALPEDYIHKAKEVLEAFCNSPYAKHVDSVLNNGWVRLEKRIFNNSKINDHFAIIPTGKWVELDEAERKIYDMIVRRFIAAFYPSAEYRLTTRITEVAGELFKSSGRTLIKAGWLQVYDHQTLDDTNPVLCAVTQGDVIRTEKMEAKGMQTKPPTRFTESSLLSAMEGAGKFIDDDELREVMKERGLGTPATRANIIEGLLSDKDLKGKRKEPYIVREGKEHYLVPTGKGFEFIKFLDTNGVGTLTSPKMTGEWEWKLREMEKGRYNRNAFMSEIEIMVRKFIDIMRQKAGQIATPKAHELLAPCPKCRAAILSDQRVFKCKAECGVGVWREIAGRTLSEAEAEILFKDGKIDNLDGFLSKSKRKFTAGLRFNSEFKVEFIFDNGIARNQSISKAEPEIDVPCPKCRGVIRAYEGEHPRYMCDNGDFKIWKKIAGRMLSDTEAVNLIRDGVLPVVHGFVSSKGKKKFSAGLSLSSDTHQINFVFNKLT